MATIDLFVATNMQNARTFYGYVLAANQYMITIYDGYNRGTYYGSFRYDVEGAVFGTLSSYYAYAGNQMTGAVSGLSVDANIAWSLIQNDRLQEFFSYALSGNDRITGSNFSDVLIGYAGNDYIEAYHGNDLVLGNDGDDVIAGSGGFDTLHGEGGNDSLIGDADNDYLTGGDGADTLNGGGGSDFLDGGSGVDVAVYRGSSSDYRFFRAGSVLVVNDAVVARDGIDTLGGTELLRFADGQFRAAELYLGFIGMGLISASFGASPNAGGWSSQDLSPRLVEDINGDGFADIVGFGGAGAFAALANGSGGFGPMYLAHTAFGANSGAGGWSSESSYPRMLADINGDGRADIVGFGGAGVFAALADGSGSFGPMYLAYSAFGANTSAGGWSSQDLFPRMMADINGDGRADIVGFGGAGVFAALADGSGSFGPMYLAYSAFGASPSAGGWSSQNLYPRMMADINGDGRDDIVGFGGAGVFAAIANGSGSFGPMYLAYNAFGANPSAGGWSSEDLYPRMLADVNGDGRADIIGFGGAGSLVAIANGSGGFGATQPAYAAFGANSGAGGWSSQNLYPRMVGDINGDGRDDIVGFGGSGALAALADYSPF